MAPEGKGARLEAFRILASMESGRADLQEKLMDAIAGNPLMEKRDISLMTNIVYGVMRRYLALNSVLSRFLDAPLHRLDVVTATLLRIGAFQILYLSRVPPYAAVNESVNLAKKIKPASAGLVNAVLKKICVQGKEALRELDCRTRASLPQWLYDELLRLPYRFEPESLNTHSRMSFRVNAVKMTIAEVIAALEREGTKSKKSEISEMGIITDDSAIFRSRLFRDRLIVPQDEASQLAVEILEPQKGEKILDLCAGRGVKTTQIAVKTADSAEILALDSNPEKLDSLIDLAASAGIGSIATLCMDARRFKPDFPAFDRVLIDAPCTGSGTIRRRPEIRYRISKEDAKRLSKLQSSLLKSGAKALRPGGTLVYSVCSFLNIEGQDVINNFLMDRSDFCCEKEVITFRDYLGIDGFYIARLRKSDHHGHAGAG